MTGACRTRADSMDRVCRALRTVTGQYRSHALKIAPDSVIDLVSGSAFREFGRKVDTELSNIAQPSDER
jgi:hypothetical protein